MLIRPVSTATLLIVTDCAASAWTEEDPLTVKLPDNVAVPVSTDCVDTEAEVTDEVLVSAPQLVVPRLVVPDVTDRLPAHVTAPL